MHHYDLENQREHLIFNGYNFYDWLRVLKENLERDQKLYTIEGPIPEQPDITNIAEHNDWWKYCNHSEDVSEMIKYSVIPDLWEELEGMDAFYMLRQVRQISHRYRATWFEPDQTREECKPEVSHPVCSKRPLVQGKVTFKPKKSKKAHIDGSCFYCGETGHWKRNCPSYLIRKSRETSTSGIY